MGGVIVDTAVAGVVSDNMLRGYAEDNAATGDVSSSRRVRLEKSQTRNQTMLDWQ